MATAFTRQGAWMVRRFSHGSSGNFALSPNFFDVVNPATGTKIAELPDEPPQHVFRKFEMLEAGQKRWKTTAAFHRKEILEGFTRLLLSNTDALAKVLTSETGKPISQARREVRAAVERIRFYLENYEKVLSEQTVLNTSRLEEKVVYEPLGVVANISAWNYPYFTSANVFAAALVTGNSVLYKPSEHASLSGQQITKLLHEAGVPEDVFMITTGKASTGSAVASLKGLGGIFFTGSNQTGLVVAQQAAKNLVKAQLELGGKDPVYVRQDVQDVAMSAASIADGAFYNCGQSCCSVERIYVDKAIYTQFVDHFISIVQSFKIGDPLEGETYIGPVARRGQLSFLANQVMDALDKGATAEIGAEPNFPSPLADGFYFQPTVLLNVNHSMSVMREESFGPIIGIQAVHGDSEALSLMRDTNYGLTASVYCQSSSTAEALLRELNVGTGYWNCCDRVSPRLPWSGRKGSGLGATLGIDGFRSFVQPKGLYLHKPPEGAR